MREVRKLEVVLHSATDLKSASKTPVYAVAWIEPSVRVPSSLTKQAHGPHPVFDATISVAVDDRTLARGTHLNVELLGRGLVSTRRIGFVRVPLNDVLREGADGADVHTEFHAHPVTRRSGRQKGFLSFDLHLHATTDATTPPKPTVTPELASCFDMKGDQSDDTVSPSSSSEDGHHTRTVLARKRLYALRPKSFNFNGLLSC